MKNNIEWLIERAELSRLEFGVALYPEMKRVTANDKAAITSKAKRLCRQNAKIPLELLEKISTILNADYNTLFGYEKN